MSETRCGFCEEKTICRKEFIKPSWEKYLAENTDLYATDQWKVAICVDCYDRWSLHSTQFGYTPNDPQDDAEVRRLLDDIKHLYEPYE